MTLPAIAAVDDPRVALMGTRKSVTQTIGVTRNQDEMHMIGHQAPRQNLAASRPAAIANQIDVARVIASVEKCLLPPVPTLDDVVGNSWNNDTSGTWHGVADSSELETKKEHLFAPPAPSPRWLSPITPASPFDKAAPEGSAQTVSAVLGEIVWLMSASPIHKQFFISYLEWPVANATR